MPPVERIRIVPNRHDGKKEFYEGEAVIPVIHPVVHDAIPQSVQSANLVIQGVHGVGQVGTVTVSTNISSEYLRLLEDGSTWLLEDNSEWLLETSVLVSFLVLENGGFLQMENGSDDILLEGATS